MTLCSFTVPPPTSTARMLLQLLHLLFKSQTCLRNFPFSGQRQRRPPRSVCPGAFKVSATAYMSLRSKRKYQTKTKPRTKTETPTQVLPGPRHLVPVADQQLGDEGGEPERRDRLPSTTRMERLSCSSPLPIQWR